MKLKFINLLLASVLLLGSAQVLTSCKDNEADLYMNLQDEQISLKERLAADEAALGELRKGLNQEITDRKKDVEDLWKELDKLTGDGGTIDKIETRIDNIVTSIAVINGEITTINGLIKGIDETLVNHGNSIAALEGAIAEIQVTMKDFVTRTEFNTYIAQLTPIITGLVTDVATVKGVAEANAAAIDGINKTIDQMNKELDALDNAVELNSWSIQIINLTIQNLQRQIDNLEKKHDKDIETLRKEANVLYYEAVAYADSVYNLALDSIGNVDAKVSDLNKAFNKYVLENNIKVNDLTKRVAALEKDVTEIKDAIKEILEKVEELENRISSIEIQGVDNPVFGYLSTPFGIRSNVLIAYTGKNEQGKLTLPNTMSEYEYDKVAVLSAADVNLLKQCGLSQVTIASGESMLIDADGNLGTVFFTVNPANIDLTGKSFALTNSKGDESKVVLKNIRPCTEELTFGYQRGTEATGVSANGFYVADATIAGADVNAISLSIEPGLKTAARNVIEEKSKSSIAGLAKAIYDQVDGLLPALAISASWDEAEGTQMVTSQYGLAATAVKPLSYAFGYGKSFRQFHLPNLKDFDFDVDASDYFITINTNFKINEDNIHIGFDKVVITLNDLETVVTVKVPVYQTDEDGNYTLDSNGDKIQIAVAEGSVPVVFTPEDLADLNQQLSDALNNTLQNGSVEITNQIKDVVADINKQVANLLSGLQEDINSQIEDVINDITNKVNNKLNHYVDRLENSRLYDYAQRVLNRLNKALKDPNHYLQSVLLYKNGSNYGIMSNSKNHPTVFTGAGNAVTLVPTTYTAETVTPAAKKFVAVTNVFNGSASAQAGDAKCLSLLKQANGEDYINEVIDGDIHTVPFNFNGASGYTFEIVYQAVDYSGITSTQKYYVRIK